MDGFLNQYEEYQEDMQEAYSRYYGDRVDHPKKKTGEGIDGYVLSNDLWEDILFRLPYKSLYRAKCVSKRWMTLISDAEARGRAPRFFPAFFHYEEAQRFVSLSDEPECGGMNLDFLLRNREKSFCINHSCNGLLLCSNKNYYSVSKTLYVCNPVTKKFVKLPNGHQEEWQHPPRFFLAFDPNSSIEFKVITFLSPQIVRGHIKIDLFSSQTGIWKKIIVQGKVPSVILSSKLWSIYLNGVMHIMSLHNLLGLDINKMELVSVKLPKKGQGRIPYLNIRLLRGFNGSLHFIRVHGSEVLIWELKDYSTGKWVHKHTITTSVSVKNFPFNHLFNWSFYPMACHMHDEVFYLVGKRKKGTHKGTKEIFSYDLQRRKMEKLCNFSESMTCMYNAVRRNKLFVFLPSTCKFSCSC